jgi:hypothetical protein
MLENKKRIFYLILLVLFSCGSASDEEQLERAVESARFLLSENKCAEAIALLEAEGPADTNADYIQTLASAYACRSDFDEINFFANDIALLDASANDSLIGSLTLFSTSSETTADAATYTDLMDAINVLLYAGGLTEPSSAGREAVFGAAANNDINLQVMYMLLAAMGKYFAFYGNAAGGVKGAGGGPNGCLFDYTDAGALAAVAGGADSCVGGGDGHPDLANADPGGGTPDADDLRRMCEGYIITTNLLDVMSNVTLPTSTDLGDISDLLTNVIDPIVQPGGLCDDPLLPAGICDERSQSDCETFYGIPANFVDLEQFYAVVFETMFL